MRIAFVLGGLDAGGAEKIVNLLAHHRCGLGDSVHVLSMNAKTPESYFTYDPRVSVEPFGLPHGSGSRVLSLARRTVALRRRLREIRPDVVVSFLTKVNVQAVMAGTGLRIPVIVSERNNYTLQPMNPVWAWAGRLTAMLAEGVVMQTDVARANLPKRVRRKAVVIPNPIDAVPVAAGGAGGGERIVGVGRLTGQKGFDLLLDAFARAGDRIPAATLTIFGDGPDRDELDRKAADLGITDRVRFPGVTGSPGEWIEATDIFVLSSRFEGFPNVLLEAHAAGLPSIAFDCPWGPSEIIGPRGGGILVPNGDVDALADAMVRVATDPVLRRELGTRARSDTRFSQASVLAQWDSLIETTVSRAADQQERLQPT